MNVAEWVEHTVNELGPWGRAVIVGEGAAELASRLAQAYGLRVVAVGRESRALATVLSQAPTWGMGATLGVVADAAALPFKGEVATWVVGAGVLNAGQGSRTEVLRELRRLAKPNGHVLLAEGASAVPSEEELRSLLAEAGLQAEVVRRADDSVLVLASVAPQAGDDPDEQLRQRILQRLTEVIDPETGMDVVTMDMIVDLTVKDGVVRFKFRPTTPYCPIAVHLSIMIKRAVQDVEGVKEVDMTVVDYVDAENLTRELKSI